MADSVAFGGLAFRRRSDFVADHTVHITLHAPTIASLNYSLGDTAGGGQSIVATGTNLSSVTTVTIGGVNYSPTATTPTTCTFALPAHAIGTVNITVTNAAGTSNALTFEFWDLTQIANVYSAYDSNKSVTATAGSVSAWADLTGNGRNLTAVSNPTQVANQFGSLPSIRFTGPESLNITGGGLAAQTVWSYFAVAKWTSNDTSAAQAPYNTPLTVFGGGGWSGFGASGGAVAYTKYDTGLITGGSSLNDGSPHLIGATGDATPTIKLYHGSAQVGSTATPGGTNLNYERLVGVGYSGADGFIGDVGALVIVSDVIANGDLLKLNRWSQQRFGTYNPGVSAPTISSKNHSYGDILGGGQSIVFTGTDLDTVTSVTFGATSATITAQTSTTLTVTLPAHAAGAVTVTVSNPAGSGTTSFEFVDPTSYVDYWMEGTDYNSGTGVWTARKGTTANYAGSMPAAGTLNSLQTVDFNGTNSYMTDSTAIATYITNTQWFALTLFNCRSAGHNASVYPSPAIIQETTWQNFGLMLDGTGPVIQNYFWTGTATHDDQTIAFSTWELDVAKYDGVKIYSQLGLAGWDAGTTGTMTALNGAIQIGRGTAYYDGQIAIIALAKTIPSDANIAKIVGAVNQRWGTSY